MFGVLAFCLLVGCCVFVDVGCVFGCILFLGVSDCCLLCIV